MLHFFPRFARNVDDTPFATELRRLTVPHVLFAEELNRQYATRAGLLLRVYPTLLFCAARAALRSLVLSRPKPDAVVITSDVEAIVFGLVRAVASRRTRIVFETFIATERGSRLGQVLHRLYYGFALSFVDVAICHSETEARANAKRFGGRTRFAALPYALSVAGRSAFVAEFGAHGASPATVLSAGRSGRDYATLAKAVADLPCAVRVVCDWERPTQPLEGLERVTLLRDCFGMEFLREIARARIVVVPLSQRNVSAGQMVLLQAFALGKPVVVTDTPTIREYATDGVDAVLAEFGNPDDLREKIAALLADPARAEALGRQASLRYDANFSTEAYVRKLVALLDAGGPAPPRAAAPRPTDTLTQA